MEVAGTLRAHRRLMVATELHGGQAAMPLAREHFRVCTVFVRPSIADETPLKTAKLRLSRRHGKQYMKCSNKTSNMWRFVNP